jgi:hypothetical protein
VETPIVLALRKHARKVPMTLQEGSVRSYHRTAVPQPARWQSPRVGYRVLGRLLVPACLKPFIGQAVRRCPSEPRARRFQVGRQKYVKTAHPEPSAAIPHEGSPASQMRNLFAAGSALLRKDPGDHSNLGLPRSAESSSG